VLAQVERSNGKNKRASAVNAGDVHAPMPGLVVNVLAVEGQQVASGEVLVVLESMKMQMEFRAPFAGRVDKVAVKNNQQVEKGSLLVRVLEN
jgi:biotin carboxyl carrier protein